MDFQINQSELKMDYKSPLVLLLSTYPVIFDMNSTGTVFIFSITLYYIVNRFSQPRAISSLQFGGIYMYKFMHNGNARVSVSFWRGRRTISNHKDLPEWHSSCWIAQVFLSEWPMSGVRWNFISLFFERKS